MRVFFVYFWHSEGWTPRNEASVEAVVKQARTTKHPWLIAGDANMSPKDFENVCGFKASRCSSRRRREHHHADQEAQTVS